MQGAYATMQESECRAHKLHSCFGSLCRVRLVTSALICSHALLCPSVVHLVYHVFPLLTPFPFGESVCPTCPTTQVWPIMGAGYHTIHHTTYKHNYGHYTVGGLVGGSGRGMQKREGRGRCVCVFMGACVALWLCVYSCMHVCVCVFACMVGCECVCMCV